MSLEGGAGAILGGIAGFFLGGPAGAVQGAQIGYAVGSALGAEGQSIQGPRLQDLKVQSSAYGKDIPIVYGSARMSGNIIWGLPLRETATEEDQGKGGGGSTVTTYTYDATFAVLLCEGPIVGIRKIWAYGELIYNLSDDASLETIIASNRAARSFNIYTGTETQEPDPLIQADLGAANTQAYRGYAYVVLNRLQLEKYGNRIPELTFEVVGAGDSSLRLIQTDDIPVSGASFNHVASYWNHDAGYLASWVGDWDSSYATNNVDVYKQYANGNIEKITSFSVPGTDASYNPVNTYSRDAAYCMFGGGSVLNRERFRVYRLGVETVTVATFQLTGGVTQSNSTTECCIYDDTVYVLSKSTSSLRTIQKASFSSGVNTSFFECEIIASSDGDLNLNPHAFDISADIIYVLNSDNTIDKFGLDGVLIDTLSISFSPAISYLTSGGPSDPQLRVVNDKIWVAGDLEIFSMNLDGSGIEYFGNPSSLSGVNPDNSRGGTEIYGGVFFQYRTDKTSSQEYKYRTYQISALSADGVTLSAIQSEICERAGLSASDIDVTELTDTVTGYVVPRNMSGRSASEQLMKAFFYDAADINNKITFVKRGKSPVATITADDLGAHYYGSDFETISHDRLQDPELPSEIIVKHIDVNRAYQDGAQRSQRITHPVENISTNELSIVMTATRAKQIAEIWMQNAYTERDKYSFSLSRDFIDLNPADVITVPTGGGNRDLRINKITYAPVIDIEAVADSPYTSNAEAGEGDAIGGNVGLQGPTNLLLLDIPLLRNADNDEGIYLAASGYYDAWTGAQVFTSNSEEDGYTSKTSIFNDAVIGSATTALADASAYDWDRANTVTIQLINGDLSSVSEDLVAQGNNYCILGNEIIQYANATLNADGTYTLDTLTRGRRGTDWATGSHTIGDRFVFIGALTLKRIDQAFNALKYYKAATFGTFLDEADARSLTNTGVSLKPFSGYQLAFALDGSNNLTGSWQTRSRYIAPTFRDLPLFEGSEEYEIDIFKSGVVLVTKTVTTNALSYTASQQTSDGLTPGDFDTIRVYQMSEIVGRGYVAEYTL